MATRYRRKALKEFIEAGDRWTTGLLVLVVIVATYGLVQRFGG
jgi:hypothetical protein